MNQFAALRGFVLCAMSAAVMAAHADPIDVDVDAIDAIYNADAGGTYSNGNPVAVAVPTGAIAFTFSGTASGVTFNGGGNINDADGVGAAVSSSSNTGTATLSGITAPNAGYLVGVFLGATSGAKPASPFYATTDSAAYSPTLQQVFFIGDGLAGDGTGASQTFFVPTGATTLFLGFSDAADYNGSPGAYDDNNGFINGEVSFVQGEIVTPPPPPPSNGVPEPAAVALLGLGALAAGLVRRKR